MSLSPSADYDMDEIRALCQSHCSWTDGAESRALHLVHHVQKISGCQETLPVLSAQELKESQQEDPTVSKELSLFTKQRHPLRRERDNVMYRVTKDPLSKKKRFQYMMPGSHDSMISQAIMGRTALFHLLDRVFIGLIWKRTSGNM